MSLIDSFLLTPSKGSSEPEQGLRYLCLKMKRLAVPSMLTQSHCLQWALHPGKHSLRGHFKRIKVINPLKRNSPNQMFLKGQIHKTGASGNQSHFTHATFIHEHLHWAWVCHAQTIYQMKCGSSSTCPSDVLAGSCLVQVFIKESCKCKEGWSGMAATFLHFACFNTLSGTFE